MKAEIIDTAPDPMDWGYIAVCLSGGGDRAAAFHLGVMKSSSPARQL